MCSRTIVAIFAAFGFGILAGRGSGPRAAAQDRAPADPLRRDAPSRRGGQEPQPGVARWKALGFTDIRVSPLSKGTDRTYHGEPIDVALKQAFVHGMRPMIEMMEPVRDGPSPSGDFLKEHGEALHYIAFRLPDAGPELEKYRRLGMEEVASGKWPEGESRWGTFH